MTDKPPAEPKAHQDVRPLVGRSAGNRGLWIFASLLALCATSLFAALEMRRAKITEPALGPRTMETGQILPPPDLAVPPDPNFADQPYYQPWPMPAAPALPPPPPAQPSMRPPRAPVAPAWQENMPAYVPPPPQTQTISADEEGLRAPTRPADIDGDRVRATRFVNPSTTVPKGTVIQAVMETALDSTRPGFARGVVSRDVYSFDGSRILIPRGSRLIGDYKADLASGQNRALIIWERLMRPDGVTINLSSPAADPLGRAGVKGKVDSHFWARFGGAILQSTLNIAERLAAREVDNGTVVVAMSGSTQSVGGQIQNNQNVQPTLKVAQGASMSVFVARDLDFTDVDR